MVVSRRSFLALPAGALAVARKPVRHVSFAFAELADEYDAEHVRQAIMACGPDVVALPFVPRENYAASDEGHRNIWLGSRKATRQKKEALLNAMAEQFKGARDQPFIAGFFQTVISREIPLLRIEDHSQESESRLAELRGKIVASASFADRGFRGGDFSFAMRKADEAARAKAESDALFQSECLKQLNDGHFFGRAHKTYPELGVNEKSLHVLVVVPTDHSAMAEKSAYPGQAFYPVLPEVTNSVILHRNLTPGGWLAPQAEITRVSLARHLLAMAIGNYLNEETPYHVRMAYANSIALQCNEREISDLVKNHALYKFELDALVRGKGAKNGLYATADEMKQFVVSLHSQKVSKARFETWWRDLTPKK